MALKLASDGNWYDIGSAAGRAAQEASGMGYTEYRKWLDQQMLSGAYGPRTGSGGDPTSSSRNTGGTVRTDTIENAPPPAPAAPASNPWDAFMDDGKIRLDEAQQLQGWLKDGTISQDQYNKLVGAGEWVNDSWYAGGKSAFDDWLANVPNDGISDAERANLETAVLHGKITQDQLNALLGGGAQPPATQPPSGGPTGGGQGSGNGVNSSWDWAGFADQVNARGGSFGTPFYRYNTGSRYIPGEDSPWGSPGIEGDNKRFYQKQFSNLLKSEQDYQNAVDQAAQEYQGSQGQYNPITEGTTWDWAYGGRGLPEVQVGTGEYAGIAAPTDGYSLLGGANKDMSNEEFVSRYSALSSANPDVAGWFSNILRGKYDPKGEMPTQNWASYESPDAFSAALKAAFPQGENAPKIGDFANTMWTANSTLAPGTSTQTTAKGYAVPGGWGSGWIS